jgi:hypothetical protein
MALVCCCMDMRPEEELVEPNCIDYTPSSRTTSVRLRFDLVEMHTLRSVRPLAA